MFKILEKLKKYNADFIMLNSINEFSASHNENTELARLTGFLGSAGEALVNKDGKIFLFVDPRYHISAKNLENESLEAILLDMGEGFLDGFKKVADENSKILIPASISHLKFLKYQEHFKNLIIIDSKEEKLKKDVEIYSISDDIFKTKTKIDLIKEKYQGNLLVTSTDEIAYILDIRAFEFDYMSSFSSRLFLGEKNILFCDYKIPENYDFIKVLPLSEFEEYISSLEDEIYYDEENINEKTFSLIKNPIKDEKKLIQNMMSIKSKFEIEHLKFAFSKLDEAIFAFREKIKKGMSEIELKNLFESELMATGARGLSFKTLLAVGENSASIHYSDYSDKKVQNSGDIILLDCGGYWDLGLATDITRVFAPFGATYKQKKVYTQVLKAQIKAYLESSNKPYILDKVARDYLEAVAPDGFEFSHALGHGIGQSVHQHPPTLSPRTKEDFELLPNMVFSIEPGLYKEGEFGIRLENSCYLDENKQKVSLSKFPYERNLIDYDMLDEVELAYLESWGVLD
ncbi:M24 family metallopeptidase [bacterium]|nr:M24 family metallopeptidase [bacterium]